MRSFARAMEQSKEHTKKLCLINKLCYPITQVVFLRYVKVLMENITLEINLKNNLANKEIRNSLKE